MTRFASVPVPPKRTWVLRAAMWLCVYVAACYAVITIAPLVTQRWVVLDRDGIVRGVQGLSPHAGKPLYALTFPSIECLTLDFALDLAEGMRVGARTEREGAALLQQNLDPRRTALLAGEWTHEAERGLERRDARSASKALDRISSLTGLEADSGLLRDWDGLLTGDAPARTRLERLCAEKGDPTDRKACAALLQAAVERDDREAVARWLPPAAEAEPARTVTRDLVRISADDAASGARWNAADTLLRAALGSFPDDDDLLARLLRVDSARDSGEVTAPELTRRLENLRALSQTYGDRGPLRRAQAQVLMALGRAERDEMRLKPARAHYLEASSLLGAEGPAQTLGPLKELDEFAHPVVVDAVVFARTVRAQPGGGWTYEGRGNRFRLGESVTVAIELRGRAVVDTSVELRLTFVDPLDREIATRPASLNVRDLGLAHRALRSIEVPAEDLRIVGTWTVKASLTPGETRQESFTLGGGLW